MAKEYDANHKLPEKVLKMYRAVMELIEDGEDIANMKVSTITDRAGIGKGTAYEYFETKEDIVANAIVYYMVQIFHWMSAELRNRNSFREQLAFLLDEVEKTEDKKVCFFRFIHFLTNGTEFSEQIRNKMKAEEMEAVLPMRFLMSMVETGLSRGEIGSEAEADYLVSFLMAQLMNYTLYITMDGDFLKISRENMRKYIWQSVESELKLK